MNGVDTANRGDVNNYGAVRTNGHANGTVNGHANGSVNGHIVSMNGTENGDCQQLNGKSTSCNGSHPGISLRMYWHMMVELNRKKRDNSDILTRVKYLRVS